MRMGGVDQDLCLRYAGRFSYGSSYPGNGSFVGIHQIPAKQRHLIGQTIQTKARTDIESNTPSYRFFPTQFSILGSGVISTREAPARKFPLVPAIKEPPGTVEINNEIKNPSQQVVRNMRRFHTRQGTTMTGITDPIAKTNLGWDT